jgi:O-antigen/teichoic acid export membrane protein
VATTMAGTRRRLREGYGRMAVGTVVSGAVTLGGTIILVLWWRADAWALLLGGLAGTAAGLAVLGLPSASFLSAPSGLPGWRRREIVAFGLAGAALAPLFWFMSSIDRWIIEARLGAGPVGIYVFATSLSQMGIFINGAITTTWFPEMTRAYTALGPQASDRLGRMWGYLVAGLLLVWLAITAAGGDALRLITDRRFHEAGAYVPWLAGGVFFYGVATLAGTGLVVAKNLRPAVAWWTAGAILDTVASLVLVRVLGVLGVAIANCLGFAFIAAGVMTSAQRRYFLRIPVARLAGAAACVVPAGAVMSFPWSTLPVVSLLLKAPLGMVMVGIVAAIVAPDWVARKLGRARSSGRKAG